MYVYSCKSGQMYEINFYLSCDYLLHEKCMGNPVHLCIWQKKMSYQVRSDVHPNTTVFRFWT